MTSKLIKNPILIDKTFPKLIKYDHGNSVTIILATSFIEVPPEEGLSGYVGTCVFSTNKNEKLGEHHQRWSPYGKHLLDTTVLLSN